jgi:hypothetical protein
MTTVKLNKSGVVFDASTHTYSTMIEGERPHIFPRSVTGIIRDNLFADEYKGVDRATLAKAADYGTKVHEEVELYERMGIELMSDEAKEIVNMRLRKRYHWLESEYFVSDNDYVAGSIDCVWESMATKGSLALADIKTTYNYNEEYVTWQLSIYAYLFELQNPGLKIDKLFCCWTKKKKVNGEERFFHECYELKRKPVAEVVALIEADKARRSGEGATAEPPLTEKADVPALLDKDAIEAFIEIKEKAEAAKEAYDELTTRMRALMRENGMKTFDGGRLRLTYTEASERTESVSVFDEAAFRKENPELYAKYVKETKKTKKTNERLTVTIRDDYE